MQSRRSFLVSSALFASSDALDFSSRSYFGFNNVNKLSSKMLDNDEAGYTKLLLFRCKLDNHPWMVVDGPGLGVPAYHSLTEYFESIPNELDQFRSMYCYLGKRDENFFAHIDQSSLEYFFENKEDFYCAEPWELAINKAVPIYVDQPTSLDIAFNFLPENSVASKWRLDQSVQRNFAQLDAIFREFKRINKLYCTNFHFTNLNDEQIQKLLQDYLR